jgi:hypothetical protein
LEYSWADDEDSTFPANATISVTDAASGTAWQNQLANFAAISGTNKTIQSTFVFRVFRDPADAADTYASDAGFLVFGVHFQQDTVGSRQITTK